MNDLKELVKLYKEHPMLIVITLVSMVIGAILGHCPSVQMKKGEIVSRQRQTANKA